MEIIRTIGGIRAAIAERRKEGATVGFVPTMGALHDGHASLIEHSAAENDTTVVSIFVNPSQFNQRADFDRYPRNLDKDAAAAARSGASILFCPSAEEMYPAGFDTVVSVGRIADTLCGASRPGHFQGVAVVVLKLFNIFRPDIAYFGQKDAQQVAVIRQVVRDLDLDVRIVSCPIIREGDGLAMSSRNVFLDKEERRQAAVLPEALAAARSMVSGGVRDPKAILEAVRALIGRQARASIDYVQIVDAETMQPLRRIDGCALLAVAVRFGETRLIDNTFLQVYN